MAQMFFNEVEAAKIAQNMETNGLAFYEKAAAKTRNPKVRDVFLQLADDERKHLAAFAELEEILQTRRIDGAGYTDDSEIGAYIDRLMQSQVFCDQCSVTGLLSQANEDLDALAVGMRAERDSILFYQEILDFVDSKEAKESFTWILKEERKHLQLLAARAESCAGSTP
jgi:rubrerythrin